MPLVDHLFFGGLLLSPGVETLHHVRSGHRRFLSSGVLKQNRGRRTRGWMRPILHQRGARASTSTQDFDRMHRADSFLQGNAAGYLDEMYKMWQDDPYSVHASWQLYFARLQDRKIPTWQAFTPPPGFLSSRHEADPRPSVAQAVPDKRPSVQLLVSAYQTQGHRHADLNPLDTRPRLALAELDPAFYGLTQQDMDREFALGPDLLPGFIGDNRQSMRLRDIIDVCQSIYCSTYGVEWQHITDPVKREWLRQRLEVPTPFHFTKAEKQTILHELTSASMLERFLATKYPSDKRFGLDGAEALAPAMTTLIDRSADMHGVDQVVIGSCHRGRLTLMGSVYGKPYEAILAEFAGKTRFQLLPGMTSDVKSHLGAHSTRATGQGRQVSLSLLANPSHLEAVDPIAGGKTRATQRLLGDTEHKHVLCVTLHGDAAFAGQGVVYETLNMSKVPIYDVGGTIRLVVNNQLGFTADSVATRSTTYCSDIARFVDAAIFHVNGDDPEAVAFVCQLAADWRATFHTDCVVDLVCYRRYGHQELDLPDLTQPVMYGKIAKHTPLVEAYASKLLAEGSVTQTELDALQQSISVRLNESFSASKDYQPLPQPSPPGWQHLPSPAQVAEDVMPDRTTAVDGGVLNSIARRTMTIPEGFKIHKNLRRIIEARKQGFEQGWVDWATAEALAYGTLCLEDHHVRLTGQDAQRGTFAHRHGVLHDQETGQTWTPLNLLSATQAPFSVSNSPLSEYAPLGFEYGFSLADPSSLVVWEAQFGDFVNNAQVVIDNLLATGEVKWMDRSGLVLLLPHGYDGQGPEHSSARLERFLQLGSEDGTSWPVDVQRRHQDCNMQVTYITSPANLFHVLRRQMHRPYRKPLVILFSKSLLRHASTVSAVSDLVGKSHFQPVLPDPTHGTSIDAPESIRRLIFCSGQVYAALHAHRDRAGIRDTAITRLEELHPFPWSDVLDTLLRYPNAEAIVWAQEEPRNGGAWQYVRDRFETVFPRTGAHRDQRILYAGRPTAAATAVGIKSVHEAQQQQLLDLAFSVQAAQEGV